MFEFSLATFLSSEHSGSWYSCICRGQLGTTLNWKLPTRNVPSLVTQSPINFKSSGAVCRDSSTGADTTVVANWATYKAAQLLAQLQHIGRLRTSDPRGRKIPEASQGLVQRSDQYSGDTGGACAPQREPATAWIRATTDLKELKEYTSYVLCLNGNPHLFLLSRHNINTHCVLQKRVAGGNFVYS